MGDFPAAFAHKFLLSVPHTPTILYFSMQDTRESFRSLALETQRFSPFPIVTNRGNTFTTNKIVGNGSFGVVYKAVGEDGNIVAIKKVELDPRYKNRELEVMQRLEHINTVKLYDDFVLQSGGSKGKSYLYLVLE